MRYLFKLTVFSLTIVVFLGFVGFTSAVVGLWHYGRDLPDYKKLADYEPPTVTRIHAGDGLLIAEYAKERRVFVPIEAMPRKLIEAFIAAEDKNFYHHPGIDFIALARAMITNIRNLGTSRRPVGASTITQQVAKNFLLSNEVSIERKIKEAILAFRIERAFSKDRIFELYLNEIYLGSGSYGCAAAALNYFDKSLGELTVSEAAFLAALPKAPNNYHPIRKRQAAVRRRDWVIGRMLDEGFIDLETARKARREFLEVRNRRYIKVEEADFFVEQVRRDLIEQYGEEGVNERGLSVRTTLDTRLQKFAEKALREGLISYDKRYGWRGPIAKISIENNWFARLNRIRQPVGVRGWQLAVVLYLHEHSAELGFKDGSRGTLPFTEMKWARKFVKWGKRGKKFSKVGDVLNEGDVILVEEVRGNLKAQDVKQYEDLDGTYSLRQIPAINGAVVAMDPHTGRVLSMVGGFDYAINQFNRVVQAKRQPGSAFKPFVYLAALDNGYTPSTMILDAPFVIDQGPGLGKWKPANYTRKFYGPSPMRLGVEKSRNLMTVRLAGAVGMATIADYAQRFGIIENMPLQLSMALGSGETTLLQLTSAYAMLVNGGKRIQPSVIDRVQNRHGKTVLRHDKRPCSQCNTPAWNQARAPKIPDERPQVANSVSAYQVVSMLEGAVKRGTGRRINSLVWPLAGKTGTTNESRDTWFIGFSPDLVVGVFVGFDTPVPLGRRETGSSVAAPIFKSFMAEALKGKPPTPFRIPPNVRLVRVDPRTGRPAGAGDRRVIWEAFKSGTEPSADIATTIIEGGSDIVEPAARGSASNVRPVSAGDLY
ncbi:MAG: penicillin-binding protein [Rickettsiales bacterium]|nr:penicillin-binding protein [Rickettsiales bacterium]